MVANPRGTNYSNNTPAKYGMIHLEKSSITKKKLSPPLQIDVC